VSDPDETVTDLGYGLSLSLISPHLLAARAHGGAARCTRDEAIRQRAGRRTPLDRALALRGVSRRAGSHLGSTLNPGRAVLTLGVFRHLRSVACIRADASPSEVLAPIMVPSGSQGVNSSPGRIQMCGEPKPRNPDRHRIAAQNTAGVKFIVSQPHPAAGGRETTAGLNP
jgi:hypothetical protein